MPPIGSDGLALPRRLYHPAQRDWLTFLETADETAGVRTVFEVEVEPGGGIELHVHQEFAECLEVLGGEVEMQFGDEIRRLVVGQAAVARAGEPHRWANHTAHPARFRVTLYPGHPGFEHGVRIWYGLAGDGLSDARGVPRSMRDLAVVDALWDTRPAGARRFLTPLLHHLATRARSGGRERALLERYCP